jgi:hypothetical protein
MPRQEWEELLRAEGKEERQLAEKAEVIEDVEYERRRVK